MRITVQGVKYEFDPAHIRNDEAMALERALGCSFREWAQALADGSASAMTGLVWLLQRRETPGLKFGDVIFDMGEITVEDDAAEAPDPTQTSAASTADV